MRGCLDRQKQLSETSAPPPWPLPQPPRMFSELGPERLASHQTVKEEHTAGHFREW